MATIVHFVGAEEPVRLQEKYDDVIAKFHAKEVGYFGEGTSRVAIYKSGIAYIQEESGAYAA
jgi:hypothetical protein